MRIFYENYITKHESTQCVYRLGSRLAIYPYIRTTIMRLRDTLHKLKIYTFIANRNRYNYSGSSSYRIVRSLCFTCTLKCNKIKTSSFLFSYFFFFRWQVVPLRCPLYAWAHYLRIRRVYLRAWGTSCMYF